MFIRTPVFFDGADETPGGAGVEQPVGGSDDLGHASPDEQSFGSAKDFDAARRALLREPPVVLHDDSPAPPTPPAGTDDASLLAELAATPAPAAPAPGAPAPEQFVVGRTSDGREIVLTPEQAKTNWEVAEALRTEQGIKGMVGQGLVALGYSPEEIQAFVAAHNGQTPVGAPATQPGATPEAPAPVDPFADLEDGEVVSGADLKRAYALLRDQAAQAAAAATQAATQPLEATIAQQQAALEAREQAVINQVATSTYHELLGQPPTEPEANRRYMAQAARVQQLADSVVVQGSRDPGEIRRALIAGHAMFVDEMETAFRGYAAGKKQAAADLPTNIGGGSAPGGEPVKEPVDLKDARRQAKAAGFFG